MKKNHFFQVITLMLPLLLFASWTYGQAVTVRGKVTDESNAPMVGVNVVVQGTTIGTVTDIDGKYQIQTEPKATLTFSFIGYKSQTVAVGNQTEINVALSTSGIDMGEVVVVGYGVQRREAVTGSVASISGGDLRDIPANNFTQALQGRLPGVQMSQTSTRPGASMEIRIRGARSLTATNDPLVVLDGVPFVGSIGDIDVNEIKSIDILKDASATAIYGSRGANGVILITTNKGEKGQKAKITYNGRYGVSTLFAKYPMMNGPEFVALRTARGQYANSLEESK
jgi:TonB-dependent starch-binding outer membrane protein SusC